MRVLHIHSGNLYGGVETVLLTLVRLRGECPEMESSFALCFDGQLSEGLSAAGAAVHQIGAVRFRWPWTIWRARRRLSRLLERERFEVAVFHSSWTYALFAKTTRKKGICIVYWAHVQPSRDHWLDRMASRRSPDLFLVNSKFIREQSKALFPNAKTEVQYPFCMQMPVIRDRDSRAVTREELASPENAVVIIVACRLERWKGLNILIEALGQMRATTDWRCWIAGGPQNSSEGSYQNELRQTAHETRIADRVRFLGQRKDVLRLMSAADIYCQPNTNPEPFGLTFVEAMSAGLPVVTTAMGGPLEIVDESCARFVPPGNSAVLAQELQNLIDKPELRESLGRNGLARSADEFAPGKLVRNFANQLRSATEVAEFAQSGFLR